MLYNYNMTNTRINKHGKQMTQTWLTAEAKQAALLAAYHDGRQSVEIWVSEAVLAYADFQEQERQRLKEGNKK